MILYKVARPTIGKPDEDTRELLCLIGTGAFTEEQFIEEYQERYRTRRGMAQESFSTFIGWDMIYPYKEIVKTKRITTRKD